MTLETGQLAAAVLLALLAAFKSAQTVDFQVPDQYLADLASALAPDPAGLAPPP